MHIAHFSYTYQSQNPVPLDHSTNNPDLINGANIEVIWTEKGTSSTTASHPANNLFQTTRGFDLKDGSPLNIQIVYKESQTSTAVLAEMKINDTNQPIAN